MELTHEHVKRAYSILGFDECGRFLSDMEHRDVMSLALQLSQKRRKFQ